MRAATQGGFGFTVFPIANVLAAVVVVFSATMLAAVALGLILGNDAALFAFLQAAVIGMTVGAIAWFSTRTYHREFKIRDGIWLVALTWALLPLVV